MNPTLLTKLRHLRLSGMVEALPARLAQAEGGSMSFLDFLELIVEDELARRADRLFARRVKQATIPTIKELKDFDWGFNPKIPKNRIVDLAAGRFVAQHTDALLIGPPGLGKSHIATAIAIGAIRAGYRALIRSAFDLCQDFVEADALGQRKDFVQRLTKVDVLIIEDFGMKKLGPAASFHSGHHESPDTRLGCLPGRRPCRNRHPRPLPLARPDHPASGEKLPPAPAAREAERGGERMRGLRKLPDPWKTGKRPPVSHRSLDAGKRTPAPTATTARASCITPTENGGLILSNHRSRTRPVVAGFDPSTSGRFSGVPRGPTASP